MGPPALTPAQAEGLVWQGYRLRVRAEPLNGEHDQNFLVATDDGRQLVLKVGGPGQSRRDLELQHAAFRHLAGGSSLGWAPQAVTAMDGMDLLPMPDDGPEPRLIRLLTYLPGRLMAGVRPWGSELLADLGRTLGDLTRALAGFDHPAADRALHWDLAQAGWIAEDLRHIDRPDRQALVLRQLDRFQQHGLPRLPGLPHGVIHGDVNDHNVVVDPPGQRVIGLIDFGDMVRAALICDLAIACAYATFGAADPVAAAAAVVRGYVGRRSLDDAELAVLDCLIRLRLSMTVTNSARRRNTEPPDPYAVVSESAAWAALERLDTVPPGLATARLRLAAGLVAVPDAVVVRQWLADNAHRIRPVLHPDPADRSVVVDLGVASPLVPVGVAPAALGRSIRARLDDDQVGFGRYDEARLLGTTASFYRPPTGGRQPHPTDERRTVHLGVDLFVPPGSAVHAALDGLVVDVGCYPRDQDYGGVVLLRHQAEGSPAAPDQVGLDFYTLYGHLAADVVDRLQPGQPVGAGQRLGSVGDLTGNGGWAPHLHLQVLVDDLGLGAQFPGVCTFAERSAMTALCPDPNLLLRVPAERFPAGRPTKAQTRKSRSGVLGPNLGTWYSDPLKLQRGFMQYLYDETGRCYLDACNNVPHVGHSHPRVVAAGQAQLAVLNTNTRYLTDVLIEYAERLAAKFPDPLGVCYFVNSGSEATELALRMARAHTGRRDLIVADSAYHGHTTTLIEASPYKAEGVGGSGLGSWVHKVPTPDVYRGQHRGPDAGVAYGRELSPVIASITAGGAGLGGFIIESLMSCGGQIVPPEGYLEQAYELVRAAGGVCIADEVQVGFGRVGSHYWGFQRQGVVPDIVALGKPMGNGHPIGAVVTTAQIAASFDNGMRFFSTFGGNTVSCAIGLEVLKVIDDERLQQHAAVVGDRLMTELSTLMGRHEIIGDVRGCGLFVGIELVRDRGTLEPAAAAAGYLMNRMREEGVLVTVDGPLSNVIKIKPPMRFGLPDADRLVEVLDEVLGETPLEAGRTE
jgi:4-aminobutyrate aminotransferase-like enzyme/Ser/Thr protein kinase RdoA (MazF antagonist)/murein DD-endopeptidase MepM/ murein hydrolase activator NlpD